MKGVSKIEHIYNSLFEFEEGKKKQIYPIHKKLQFEKSLDFKKFTDISDWILANLELNQSSNILDAGCGVGYVLLKLCEAYKCKGLGISLSNKEIEAAKLNAQTQQLNENCLFRVQNFDDVKDETFDLVIAVESIKHSSNVKDTLVRFQQYLKEDGQILIVEDYLNPAYKNHSLTNKFSYAWNVPIVYTENEFKDYYEQAKLSCVESIDFTSFIFKRNSLLTQIKLNLLKLSNLFVSTQKKQTKLNIYKGALIMDYFYAKGIFEYKLKVLKN